MDDLDADKHPIEEEFKDIDNNNKWNAVYQKIRIASLNQDYTVEEAKKKKNKDLNRYRDVSPYDHSRVVLNSTFCDYINASLVKVPRAHRQYILTQGPLPGTAGHFWLMVWEQMSAAVIMLNKVVERNQIKCHQYFPLNKCEVMEFPDVGIRVEYVDETNYNDYTVRTLSVLNEDTQQSRQVLHFHYTAWPDFLVPESAAFLRFLFRIRESGVLNEEVGPCVVHCSAGIGRSGTLCLVDSCLVMIEESGEDSVSVKEVLLDMRQYRMGLIQTHGQLRFSYLAIIEGIKQLSGESSLSEDYVNSNHIDEPPPLPPRSDSLTSSSQENTSTSCSDGEVFRPLPPIPPCDDTTSASDISDTEEPQLIPTANINNDNSNEVRKRREERNAELADKVANMKRKQAQSETWQQRKRFLCQPITIGIGLLVIGTAFITYKYFSFR